MENDKRDEIIALYDLYGSLLTEKQQQYFEDYYFMDLSITEISENYSISRNGAFDQIKKAIKNLMEYEKKLHLNDKIKKIEQLSLDNDIKEEVLNIIKE